MTKDEINSIAKRVINVEADALKKMADDLPNDFCEVVEVILKIQGRVIVSGVGKSGHIGNKIAATLASTGTPSYFVHATEASHGDLGNMTPEDFCLLISNSGETPELQDIVAYTRRFGIPLAAISSKPNSSLMRVADYKLTITSAPEACAIGMAPTTSTTLTLALGDALAVALMEKYDFKPENFRLFHPGGKLGAQLSNVRKLMRPVTEMAILQASTSMKEVILSMTQTGYGLAVLLDKEQKIVGVISDGDLRRNAEKLFDRAPITIASKTPISVSPEDLLSFAINKMEANKVYSILVVEHEQPVGLLRMHDLLRAGLN